MSGVIDSSGQWEKCNVCREFVLFVDAKGDRCDLYYERPSLAFPHGRDLCRTCLQAEAAYNKMFPSLIH